MAVRALDDLRVLDISESAAGAWCSRLLADFGAEVLMVEGPAGHPLRREAPFDSQGRSIAGELFLADVYNSILDNTALWESTARSSSSRATAFTRRRSPPC